MFKLSYGFVLMVLLLLISGCSFPNGNQTKTPERSIISSISYPEITLSDTMTMVAGQTIYAPVYAYIFFENSNRTLNLTTTLSIRNTDINYPIIITEINYYDAKGELVKEYLNNPIQLKPLASAEFVANRIDTSGGMGANFLVKWVAENKVSDPLVESIMISTISTQGISFVSKWVVISEKD